mgnify:FL=1
MCIRFGNYLNVACMYDCVFPVRVSTETSRYIDIKHPIQQTNKLMSTCKSDPKTQGLNG